MKNKMYATQPRAPMMYGGVTPKKAMMGGTQMSAPKTGANAKMAMAAAGMMYGGKAKK